MAQLVSASKITVIAPEGFEKTLSQLLLRAGATGYTTLDARGHGVHGTQYGDIAGSSILIISIVSDDIAEGIISSLADMVEAGYQIMVFSEPAQVVRRGSAKSL
jgi:hypothetical protein